MFFMQGQLTSLNEGSSQEEETKEDESDSKSGPPFTQQERKSPDVNSV